MANPVLSRRLALSLHSRLEILNEFPSGSLPSQGMRLPLDINLTILTPRASKFSRAKAISDAQKPIFDGRTPILDVPLCAIVQGDHASVGIELLPACLILL